MAGSYSREEASHRHQSGLRTRNREGDRDVTTAGRRDILRGTVVYKGNLSSATTARGITCKDSALLEEIGSWDSSSQLEEATQSLEQELSRGSEWSQGGQE